MCCCVVSLPKMWYFMLELWKSTMLTCCPAPSYWLAVGLSAVWFCRQTSNKQQQQKKVDAAAFSGSFYGLITAVTCPTRCQTTSLMRHRNCWVCCTTDASHICLLVFLQQPRNRINYYYYYCYYRIFVTWFHFLNPQSLWARLRVCVTYLRPSWLWQMPYK